MTLQNIENFTVFFRPDFLEKFKTAFQSESRSLQKAGPKMVKNDSVQKAPFQNAPVRVLYLLSTDIHMTGVDATITATVRILRREREKRRHSLSEFENDGTQRAISLDREETVIGRAPDAHVRLTSKRASRQHAFLRVRGTDCVLVDNDSHNGVILNGVKVHSAVLHDGDVIQVADNVFVYHEE